MSRRLILLAVVAVFATACTNSDTRSSSTLGEVATTSTLPMGSTTTLPPATTTTTIPKEILSGKVVDGRGQPLAGATVSSSEVNEITGPDGWFRLIVDEPGEITISKRGWETVVTPWDNSEIVLRVPMDQAKVRGIRVGAGAAGDDDHFARLLDLARQTAVNTFVFDTKQEGGQVVYDTELAKAHEIGAVEPWYDPRVRVAEAKANGLHTITRIVVFEDSFRSRAFPEEKLAGPWLDPRVESVWEYNIELAVEACAIGFDEIQFDYVRFPAGRTATVSGQLELSQDERVAAIEAFLARARSALRPMGCAMSADIFAIVVSVPDDQGLGQRPEELSEQLDAISPMVYPSHYSEGWLGFPDPNDFPYEVTADAIDDALPRLTEGAVLRPWLQAFWWSNAQIREAIQAAEDRDVGWILWNVRSNFDLEALPTDAEVTP